MDQAFLPIPEAGLMFKPNLSNEEIYALSNLFCMNEESTPFIHEQIKNTDPDFRAFLGKSIAEGKMFDEIKLLKNFQKPVCIIHGENDPLINLEYIETIAIPQLWKNKINIISGAGHLPQYENYLDFNEILKEFMSYTSNT